jgi:hypothetical protein
MLCPVFKDQTKEKRTLMEQQVTTAQALFGSLSHQGKSPDARYIVPEASVIVNPQNVFY